MDEPVATVDVTHKAIIARFGATLHFHVPKPNYIAMSSWRQGSAYFAIEFVLIKGTLLLEYDQQEKWETILTGLEKALLTWP